MYKSALQNVWPTAEKPQKWIPQTNECDHVLVHDQCWSHYPGKLPVIW